MELKKTRRGFLIGNFKDSNNKECSIQESSVATYGAIWLGVNGTARMHIGRTQAAELIPLLQYFVDYGMLPAPLEVKS